MGRFIDPSLLYGHVALRPDLCNCIVTCGLLADELTIRTSFIALKRFMAIVVPVSHLAPPRMLTGTIQIHLLQGAPPFVIADCTNDREANGDSKTVGQVD